MREQITKLFKEGKDYYTELHEEWRLAKWSDFCTIHYEDPAGNKIPKERINDCSYKIVTVKELEYYCYDPTDNIYMIHHTRPNMELKNLEQFMGDHLIFVKNDYIGINKC